MVPGCPGQLLSLLAGLVQEKMGGSSGAVGFPLNVVIKMNTFQVVTDSLHCLIHVSFSCIVCS